MAALAVSEQVASIIRAVIWALAVVMVAAIVSDTLVAILA